MELQKGPTMTRTQEWNCLSAQQLVHQLLVCDIERARRFVQANANDWLAERGGIRTLGTGVSPYNGFSNCRHSCDALQSQLFTVALRYQNSPNVISFVNFGTPVRTVDS